MKITFVTVSAPAVQYLLKAGDEIRTLNNVSLDLKIYYAVNEVGREKAQQIKQDIVEADATFLDLMGSPPMIIDLVTKGCEQSNGHIIPYGASARQFLRLGKFTASSMNRSDQKAPSMEMIKKMQSIAEGVGKILPGAMHDMRNYSLLMKYFQNATASNIENMLVLLLKEYGGYKNLPKPQLPEETLPIALYPLPELTPIKDPLQYAKIAKHRSELPNVLLIFSAFSYPTDTVFCVSEMKRSLEEVCNVYALGTGASFQEYEKELRNICEKIPGKIQLILNCTPFRLSAGPMGGDVSLGTKFLEDMNVLYLHPFFFTRRTQLDWENSIAGCSPGETLISVMLPELDGSIDTLPVGAMKEVDSEIEMYDLVPIEERLLHLKDRVKRYLSLYEKSNENKRIALICYNYPPGEDNLFGGAFLDTFESISHIVSELRKQGYKTSDMSPSDLMNIFCAGKAVNAGKYEMNWEEAITYDAKKYQAPAEVSAVFGKKPGDIMAENGNFFIPGVINGNLFIGLQPPRNIGVSLETNYHDKSTPPHHQYVAFYQWIKEEFQADAIVHVGTHGTLEFLKGKESGMSADCYPDRLISDLSHIYLYYLGNPAEAIIAKRRTAANLVSYQPPVFIESELYGEYLELSALLDSYSQAIEVAPESIEDSKRLLVEKAKELQLPEDPHEIESELYRLQHSLIPKGLHVFGTNYTPEEVKTYLSSLEKRMLQEGEEHKNIEKKLARIEKSLSANHEMEGLLQALSSRYNNAKLGGDIFRSPEVLPAGYNLFQFDPRLVPSKAAMERGRKIAENTIQCYFKEHGEYPRSTAMILWGLETSRTQGETLGQILGYLGVRFSKDTQLWEQRFEFIALEELGRPRIDVTINICGFFRDMFPNIIEGLDDLLRRLYDADEPMEQNFFKANSRKRYLKLIDLGYAPQEAQELATSRVFGPPEGEYGTNLTGLIHTKEWQDESELGLSFTASLRHVYSRRLHGKKVEGLYEDNLRCVEIVSQLRSSNEYEITDLDHYYEFFGGLAKSVELVRGEKVSMYITDTTGVNPLTETVEKSISRGIRTRVLNPRWIDGMLSHKSHGAQKIADRFENVMGLSATTGSVDPWIYDDLDKTYVENEDLRARMAENNPHAYMKLLEQMMEYSNRGYWNASDQQIERIKDIYLSMEEELEGEIK